jgi:vancomycin permeability regulator SanA
MARAKPAMVRRVRLAFLALLVACLFAATAIAIVGLHDHGDAADIIVVPGNTVHADGSLSERLKARLDAAITLYQERRAPLIFVSGGTGIEGRDEAVAMAAYLVANNIPANAIVQDPLGIDTAATASNAAKYLKANKLRTAFVATQYFHIARTALALERQGVKVTGTRHARYVEFRDVYSLAREVIGYLIYFGSH